MQTDKGTASLLGATLMENGVNFSLFSPFATEVTLLLFSSETDSQPIEIKLDPQRNKTYYYWHIFVRDIGVNQLYGYRINGEYNEQKGLRFDDTKVLVDPYAKSIVGQFDRDLAQEYGKDNTASCLKSVVISDEFDWEGITPPEFDISKAVIYELHPSGMTKNPNSGVTAGYHGTFMGLIEKIPFLKELGVNIVELMPVYAYDIFDAPKGKTNYWGYAPINFFALHPLYSHHTLPQDKINEFKILVKELHRNGIKIILDVVYNHTCENNYDGPTYCFRGIGNNSYYILNDKGENKDFSGCGNTVNTQHSVVRRMILDSLEYWSRDMHIDGFRFDLAAVLSRDEQGNFMKDPPILWSIDSHPELSKTILIAEPWDATGLNQEDNFPGDKWMIWNGRFRDVVRKFVKGDLGVSGDFVYRFLGGEGSSFGRYFEFIPKRHINFITAHDGFTLHDLVSYNQKHNMDNGEDNRDGNNNNYSWNCGEEGETHNPEILKLRDKQAKNFLIFNHLSHGIPMLLMGDSFLRTQQGNNNAFCQDNEISWMDWDLFQKNASMFEFTKHLIYYRKKFEIFSYDDYYEKMPHEELPYALFHMQTLNALDWYNYQNFSMELIYPKYKERILFMINMYHQDIELALPKGEWQILANSSSKNYDNSLRLDMIEIENRSVLVLFEDF